MRHPFAIVLTLSIAVAMSACSRRQDTTPPVAGAVVTLSRSTAAVGSPIEMTYRFTVASSPPPVSDDDMVFVHFLDRDGELLWTDDHQPPTPVREWKPGAVVEYTRTMFVPKVPYAGETHVDIGLYSPRSGSRLPLTGQDVGMHAYRVATLNLARQSDTPVVVFKEGWHETEVAEGGNEWQWSRKEGVLSFRNPRRDAQLLLEADQPVRGVGPQAVELRIGSETIDRFTLRPGDRTLRRVNADAAQLGTADTVEVTVAVDRTFVPASIPELKSRDTRVLGIRVFRAYVQPK
jgi:hypothetical protein